MKGILKMAGPNLAIFQRSWPMICLLLLMIPQSVWSQPLENAAPTPLTINNEFSGNFKNKTHWGVGLIGGVSHYPGLANTEDAIPLSGVGLRSHLGWGLQMSGEFLFSYHELDITRFNRVDQETVDDFMFGIDVGYDWLSLFLPAHSLSLNTGVVILHRRRQYNIDENASQAWDGGFYTELAYSLNNRLLLGLKWRYLKNMDFDRDEKLYSKDSLLQKAFNDGDTLKLEELDSHFVLLSLHYLF